MVVILAELTKFSKRHNFIISNPKQITHLVSDEMADDAILKKYPVKILIFKRGKLIVGL